MLLLFRLPGYPAPLPPFPPVKGKGRGAGLVFRAILKRELDAFGKCGSVCFV